METPEILPGDMFVRDANCYEVVSTKGSLVLLRGRYGAIFEEPVAKLVSNGYLHEKTGSPIKRVSG